MEDKDLWSKIIYSFAPFYLKKFFYMLYYSTGEFAMTYDMLENELSTNKKLSAIYLFFGEDRFLIDNSLKKIKKRFGELLQGINYVIIEENSIGDLIYNIESPAFGYNRKLIIVKNSGLFKKDGRKKNSTPIQEQIAKYIEENMEIIEESVNLVFIEENIDKNNVFNAIEKNGVVCEFKELNQVQLIKKLKQICNAYKVNVRRKCIILFY